MVCLHSWLSPSVTIYAFPAYCHSVIPYRSRLSNKANPIDYHAQRVSTLPTAVVVAETSPGLAGETPLPVPASDDTLTVQLISARTRYY
jgi:hypothetical protein